MRLSDLSDEAVGIDCEITGLTADSRAVKPGFLFAGLKGASVDGAVFAEDAVDAGAAAVLVGPDFDAPDLGVPVIKDANPRRRLALMAARFHSRQPECVVAVTGTNGKSSTVDFLRQIWAFAGRRGASLGTLGMAQGVTGAADPGLTTPDPVAVHAALTHLVRDGVTHLAMEASSHGLHQHRMDGVRLTAAGFTNLTQDHLDYHGSMEAYLAAKLRLFTELLPQDGAVVINADGAQALTVERACRERGLATRTVGWRGADIIVREIMPRAAGQRLDLMFGAREVAVELPLVGEFQAQNALLAAGLAAASGVPETQIIAGLERLKGVRGRLELAGQTRAGAPVFIDYAHTPDGLAQVLKALRPHTRGKIAIVFGAGGDRDPTKRAPMGESAAIFADRAIITDDNPRSEDPATIRAAIRQGAPHAEEVADRAAAIRTALAALSEGDACVIAGKGHETGQIVGDQVLAFDDLEVARAAIASLASADLAG